MRGCGRRAACRVPRAGDCAWRVLHAAADRRTVLRRSRTPDGSASTRAPIIARRWRSAKAAIRTSMRRCTNVRARRCHRTTALPKNVTVPAPYPPYALAFFYPLTLLPFRAAVVAWWIVLAPVVVRGGICARAHRTHDRARRVGGARARYGADVVLGRERAAARARGARARGVFCVARAADCGRHGDDARDGRAAPRACRRRLRSSRVTRAIRVPMLVTFAVIGGLSVATRRRRADDSHTSRRCFRRMRFPRSRATINIVSRRSPPRSASPMDRRSSLGSVCYGLMTALGVVAAVTLARRYGEVALVALVPPAFALSAARSCIPAKSLQRCRPASCSLRASEGAPRLDFRSTAPIDHSVDDGHVGRDLPRADLSGRLSRVYVVEQGANRRARKRGCVVYGAAGALHVRRCAAATRVAIAARVPRDRSAPRRGELACKFVLGNSTNRPAMWLLRLPTWAGLLALVWACAANASNRPVLGADLPASVQAVPS